MKTASKPSFLSSSASLYSLSEKIFQSHLAWLSAINLTAVHICSLCQLRMAFFFNIGKLHLHQKVILSLLLATRISVYHGGKWKDATAHKMEGLIMLLDQVQDRHMLHKPFYSGFGFSGGCFYALVKTDWVISNQTFFFPPMRK